ncbi:MAG: Trm112 family protein [Chloroflexi bacterium]|nr:Trm112 family protein [Chloroflexota bacterium]
MPISQELLEILACPACRVAVTLAGDELVCDRCGRRYPIRDDIPVMLTSEGDRGREAAQGRRSG